MRLAVLIVAGLVLTVLSIAASRQQYASGTGEPAGPTAYDEERIEAAKATMRARLKDPSSAQFGEVRISAPASSLGGGTVVCGFVNARNGFGGYSGMAPFIFVAGSAEIEGDPGFAEHLLDYCRR